jgi:hypothetical protein
MPPIAARLGARSTHVCVSLTAFARRILDNPRISILILEANINAASTCTNKTIE